MAAAEELSESHRRQVRGTTTLARVNTGLFHLDRLAELDPEDSWVKEQPKHFGPTSLSATGAMAERAARGLDKRRSNPPHKP